MAPILSGYSHLNSSTAPYGHLHPLSRQRLRPPPSTQTSSPASPASAGGCLCRLGH